MHNMELTTELTMELTTKQSNSIPEPELFKKTMTVVVPTYRRPQELLRCLRALETQNLKPDQVVVTVRPEDTESLEALEEFKKSTKLPLEITLVTIPGLIPAYNAGIKAARCAIICFTDDDARPHADWLQLIARHYQDPRVGGVGGRDLVYTEGELEDDRVSKVGKVNWFGRRYGNHHLELKGGRPVRVYTLKGVNSSYLRRLIGSFDSNLRGLPELANEDDMGFSILKQGYQLIYDPSILVDHFPSHKRPDSRGAKAVFNKSQVYNVNHNYTYVLLKHLPWWQQILFLLYNFVIGEVPNMALVRAVYGFVTTLNWRYFQILPAAYAGKLAGIGTYWRYRHQSKELH